MRYKAAMGSSTSGRVFLINEDCEGTGTPAGWTDVNNSTLNWDNTAIVLADAQSLNINSASGATRSTYDFVNQSEVWVYFMYRFTSTFGSTRTFAQLQPNGGGGTPVVMTVTGGTLRYNFDTVAQPTTVITTATTYHTWWHYIQGSGANATLEVGFSTNGVKPTSGGTYAIITNGTQTGLVGRLYIGNTVVVSNNYYYDNIRVAATEIGDNGVLL